MKRWKAFAGAALAAALVLAPMASMGAYADDEIEPVDVDKVFVCKYVGTPGVNETLQQGGNPVNPSINSIKGEFEEGHVIQVGDTFGDDQGRSVIIAFDTGQDPEPTIADCDPPDGPDGVIPAIPVIHDQCGIDEDEYGVPADTDEVEYGFFEGSIWAHRLIGSVWGELPDGWVDNEDGGTLTWVGSEGDFTDEPCVTVFPVPAQFNADPEPATCQSAAAFSEAFLGEPVVDEGDYREYELENIDVAVWRDVAGEVYIELYAHEGLTLEGLDEAKWGMNEEGTVAWRTILLPAQLSGPEVCPLATTPTPTPAPTPAALAATGGPNMTPWGIGAALMLIAGAALLTTRRLARR